MLRLAVRLMLDAPFKSLATLTGVVVSAFLMLQQLSTFLGFLGRVTSFIDASGVDIWIASEVTESVDATDSLPANRVAAAAGTPGVAWAEPIVRGLGKVSRPDGLRQPALVTGLQPPRYAGLPRELAPGTSPASLRATARVLMNWDDRPSFADAQPGDRIEIDGRTAVVAGFFTGIHPHAPYYSLYANIDDARSLTGFPQDRVTFVVAGLEPGAELADVITRLAARIPAARIFSRQQFHDADIRYFVARTPVGVVFGMVVAIAAFIGGAIVAVTLYSTVVDRTRDYGMMKSIGARRRDLVQLILTQAWLFALSGYGVGVLLFLATRALATSLTMKVTPALLAGVALASFLSCTLASLAALIRVLKLDPAIVFKA
jgi:putative ABC transport system permease protein